MNEVYKSGIWLKNYQEQDTIIISSQSTVSLWESIVKPTSFDTKFFEISKTNKSYKERDVSQLFNNIYLLFDYSVNQYWINNIYQYEQNKVESDKSMFDDYSNMHLVVNRYDDWQIRVWDNLKSVIVDWLKDNRNVRRLSYRTYYRCISSSLWGFQDFKNMNSVHINSTNRHSPQCLSDPTTNF